MRLQSEELVQCRCYLPPELRDESFIVTSLVAPRIEVDELGREVFIRVDASVLGGAFALTACSSQIR